MSFPVQITFRGLDHSEALDTLIRDEAAKLEKFFDAVVSCRVLVERQTGLHHSAAPYVVRVSLVVPGADLAIATEPSDDAAAAVRDTFRRARRRLQDRARRRAGPHVRASLR
ncbi:MAG TPA: HPF/RaiA family ribosome-associated protein [Candidatus Binatia bacterium]|nr:HPF/RaiA family ribosome-associated protein [Candidatus Binatia bacterium]